MPPGPGGVSTPRSPEGLTGVQRPTPSSAAYCGASSTCATICGKEVKPLKESTRGFQREGLNCVAQHLALAFTVRYQPRGDDAKQVGAKELQSATEEANCHLDSMYDIPTPASTSTWPGTTNAAPEARGVEERGPHPVIGKAALVDALSKGFHCALRRSFGPDKDRWDSTGGYARPSRTSTRSSAPASRLRLHAG